MQPHEHDPPDSADDQHASAIPLPRQPLDENVDGLPHVGTAEPGWHYAQKPARGSHRRYCGYVRYVDGAEAQRLREILPDIIRELLDWAAQQQFDDQSTEDTEDE